MKDNFGEYIKKKRNQNGISLREMAEKMRIAPSYLSDIEKGRRYAPDKEKILDMAEILKINTKEELDYLFDLAGRANKDKVAPDITEFIKDNEKVRVLLRKVKNAPDKKLDKILEILEKD